MAKTGSTTPRSSGIDRRSFLGWAGAGLGGVGLVGATAATAWPRGSDQAADAATGHAGHTTSGGEHDDAEMSRMHEKGVEDFLANIDDPLTEGVGATDLDHEMVDGVRVFELTCQDVDWEVTPGDRQPAMTFNGMVPGPTLRAVEGEKVRIKVRNEMAQSTAVHFHGQHLPNEMDGVSFVTQPPIEPGGEFTYEFVPKPFGSHMYHSHHNSAEQVGAGLFGAFLVEPKNSGTEPDYDREYLYVLNDVLGGFTINGKGWPATQAFKARKGERVRFRFVNVGQMIHPIHLHGMAYEVFARDGFLLPQPYRCDTITIAPGERWDAIVEAENPGTWAFHCHILTHAEGPKGMFGMMTVFIVE